LKWPVFRKEKDPTFRDPRGLSNELTQFTNDLPTGQHRLRRSHLTVKNEDPAGAGLPT
jgi:hypothetical protein